MNSLFPDSAGALMSSQMKQPDVHNGSVKTKASAGSQGKSAGSHVYALVLTLYCAFVSACMLATYLRGNDDTVFLLCFCGYAAAVVCIYLKPDYSQAALAGTMMLRVFLTYLMFWGVLPLLDIQKGTMMATPIPFRFLEAVLMGALESPVCLPIAFPLRVLLFFGHAGLHIRLGLPYPWIWALGINSLGLLIHCLMQQKHRQTHKAFERLSDSQQLSSEKLVMSTSVAPERRPLQAFRQDSSLSLSGADLHAHFKLGSQESTSPASESSDTDGKGAHSSVLHSPALSHLLGQAAPPYRSRNNASGSSGCRMAIKIDSKAVSMENVPAHALQKLEQRLQRVTVPGMPLKMAMRAGCVVISFGLSDDGSTSPSQSQHIIQLVEEEVKAWMNKELNIRDSPDLPSDSISVQMCATGWGNSSSSSNAINSSDNTAALDCSLSVPVPFLTPKTEPMDLLHQYHKGAAPAADASAYVNIIGGPQKQQKQERTFALLDAAITAPAGLRVRGWSCQADSPEEQEQSDVRLLACMHGQFMPVKIVGDEACADGMRAVKAHVTLPSACTNMASPYEHVVLELWAPKNGDPNKGGAAQLVSSSVVLLLPASRQAAVEELQAWLCEAGDKEREGAHTFISDLAVWVECHGASAQQLQACSFTEVGALSDVQQEMKEVGKDLVAHSVACGLTAVTGMLLDGQKAGSSLDQGVASAAGTSTAPAGNCYKEAEYREWLRNEYGWLNRAFLIFGLFHHLALIIRAVSGMRLSNDLCSVPIMLAFNVLAVLLMNRAPQWLEVLICLPTLGRGFTGCIVGSGLVPWPVSMDTVLKARVELVCEIFMCSVQEFARMSWLVPLRILTTVGYATIYMRSGVIAYPWLQSAGLSSACLLVSYAVDRRHRGLFAKQKMQEALAKAKRE